MLWVSRIVATFAALALLAPGSALADGGSLLSGYSRPGGGEQQILGPGLLPAKHGNGGIRAQTPATHSTPVTPAVPTSTPTSTPTPTPTATHHHTHAPPAHHTTPTTSTSHRHTITPGTPPTSAKPHVALPAAVVYADQNSSSGAGLPLSGSGIGLLLLAILGMAGLALAMRRAAEHPGD